MGKRSEAEEILAGVKAKADKDPSTDYGEVAYLCSVLGDLDQGFK